MTNLENLNNSEISEQEKIINNYKNEINDFKNELPITNEEVNEICASFDDYLTEFQETTNPAEALSQSLIKGINSAKSAGLLKLSKEETQNVNLITEKIMRVGYHTDLIIRTNETGKYFISPNGLIEAINELEKGDRKLIKKILKAIIKTHEKESEEHIKAEKAEAKKNKKIRKDSINKIN